MDRNGVTISLIQGTSTGGQISVDVMRRSNDYIVEAHHRYPQRLLPYCMVNPVTGQAALDEARRCLGLGMRGVKVWPWGGFPIDCPPMRALARLCAGHGRPLSVHTDNLDPRAHPYQLGRLAEAFSDLTLIMVHMSGKVTPDSVRVAEQYPNIYMDTSGTPSDATIALAVRRCGADRIMFGSDWPFFAFRPALAKIEVLEVSETDRAKIYGGNAVRLFGLRGAS
jgi:predicted TIM-barrel fold metal-dependent hydrolase